MCQTFKLQGLAYSTTRSRELALAQLWSRVLARPSASAAISSLAIQKEMFRDHFFFDKMQKIELEPVKPTQMVPE